MTDITVSATDLARRLRRFWGKRARFHRFIQDEGVAWVIVYDAVVVRLSAATAGVRVESRPVSPGDSPVVDEVVAADHLDSLLARIDDQTRAALPARFVTRFDEWVDQGGGSTSASTAPRTPGPTVTAAELDARIEAFWGSDAVVIPAPATGELSRRVRVRSAFDVVISVTEPHKVLSGGIALGDEVEVSNFGTWFSPDYSDVQGLDELLRRLDRWVRVRTGA